MTQSRAIWAVLAFVALTGCGSSNPTKILQSGKVAVAGEQVVITPDQVLCGERAGLWKIEQGDRGALGRLTPEGRALGFADDVVMGDSHFSDPYAQLSGSEPLKVAKVTQVVDDDPTTKTVTASIGVVIKHSCFDKPLPMHGAEAGAFSQDAEPRVRLKKQSGWKIDRILH
jgi:hypothetical protein